MVNSQLFRVHPELKKKIKIAAITRNMTVKKFTKKLADDWEFIMQKSKKNGEKIFFFK